MSDPTGSHFILACHDLTRPVKIFSPLTTTRRAREYFQPPQDLALPAEYGRRVDPTRRSGPEPRDALEMSILFAIGMPPSVWVCLPDGKRLRLAAVQYLASRVLATIAESFALRPYGLQQATGPAVLSAPLDVCAPPRGQACQ